MRISLLFIALFLSSQLLAQNVSDAIRYSDLRLGTSTARSLGVGGSLSAFGADYSVLSTNPAGLAAFRKSEFILTPSLRIAKSEMLLNGDKNFISDESESNFNFNSAGFVFHSKPRSGNWSTSNFSFGVNRIANFNEEGYFEGSAPGSITDRFVVQANDTGLDGFESELAYEVEAIYDLDGDEYYESDFTDYPNASTKKTQFIDRDGSINEMVFGFAGN